MRTKTTSCTECRRRKQKCDHKIPCGNCKRRFPEPLCEYGHGRKPSQQPGESAPLPAPWFRPVSLPATTPRAFQAGDRVRRVSPSTSSRGGHRRRRRRRLIVPWSGIDVVTEYPVYPGSDVSDDSEDSEFSDVGREDGPVSDGSQSVAAAASPDNELQGSGGAVQTPELEALIALQDPWYLAGPLDRMTGLPINVSKQTAILLHAFSQVHYRFKGSFDGIPDPDNPFVLVWVPYCIQSQLLIETSLFITALPLSERVPIGQPSTIELKGRAIRRLNEHLRSPACIGDDALAAVSQFIAIELYYGEAVAMRAHLRGFREMVCLRRGFPDSTMGSLVTKIALVADCTIAASLEEPSILQDGYEYRYVEGRPGIPRPSFYSPLLPPGCSFTSLQAALGIHPATAWILDEVRQLVDAAFAMLPLPTGTGPRTGAETTTGTGTGARGSSRELQGLRELADKLHHIFQPPVPAAQRTEEGPSGEQIQADDSPRPLSLLPSYPEFTASHQPSPPRTAAPVAPPSPELDPLYTAVRLAAALYTRAMSTLQPLSKVCSEADALAVLMASWRVPLSKWRDLLGIFIWIMLSVVPTVHKLTGNGRISAMVHTRFAKSILQCGWMQMSLENWTMCHESMQSVLKFQRWLRHSRDG